MFNLSFPFKENKKNKKMDKKLPIIKLNGNIDIYSILKI